MDRFNQRPSISASSSTASTSFASSPQFDNIFLTMPSFAHSTGAAAPLPSPAAQEQSAYFSSRPSQQQQHQQQQQLPQHSHMLQQHLQQQAQHQQLQAQQSQKQQLHEQGKDHGGYGFGPQRQLSSSSTDSETSLHLKDFNLLAEAAKRAQMHCVTRDFEEFGF